MRVLYLYSCGEYPARKTVDSFIYSFRRFSDHEVFYHNLAMCPLPPWYKSIHFDLVIFSHFITTPWNRARYQQKIEKLRDFGLTASKKVAFFQDEYFNIDLTNQLIQNLGVDTVYSVAPESEWANLYSESIKKGVRIKKYLTGYVDSNDIVNFKHLTRNTDRKIDIGYRIGWPSSEIFKLGKFGFQKFEIAERFLDQKHNDLNMDIKMGKDLFTGPAWFEFMSKCRYTLGCESGSSLLDQDGSISTCIRQAVRENPGLSFKQAEAHCFPEADGNLNLKAISPRIFEAALLKTGLILMEGEYSGILKPNVHYIPLKQDYSNLSEVIEKVKDEKFRVDMVERAYRDLIISNRYLYSNFVNQFFSENEPEQGTGNAPTPKGYKILNRLTEGLTWSLAGIYCQAVKLKS